MIFKECYVYLQLPNSAELITIGRLQWQNNGADTEVGTFVYGRKYLQNPIAFPIDPFELPLEEREFQTTKNDGLHGVIRDSSPDSWGRYVIQKNTPPSEHHEIGYLLNSADDRVGALSFGFGKAPPAPVRNFNKTINLNKLITSAHKIEQDLPIDESEKALLMAGVSAGGARPKTTIEDDDNLWIAKFPALNDRHNFSKIEYATMKLAKDCGLNVPEIKSIKIGANDVFLIKRFDRKFDKKSKCYFRTHFLSGLTLLQIDEKEREKWSYLDLADQMRRWINKPSQDLEELYKRMVFNGLISNTDDHPRNHGFLFSGKGYRLSPVYDLVPKPEVGSTRYSAMQVGTHGREFNLKNLLSSCEVFNLDPEKARKIFDEFKDKISKWQSFYPAQGISQSDMDYLSRAFSHWEGM